MASTKPTVPNQVNVITLKCAKDWHRAFKEQNKKGFAKGDLPSSIVIPYADVEQIVNDFNKVAGVTVNGVRLYFIIKPKQQKGRPRISGILVPTKGPMRKNPEGIYEDMVVNATLKRGALKNPDCPGPGDNNVSARSAILAADADEGYVSVYDLTRPCPPYCDENSLIVT
jgi:hypothetical protein